MLVFWMHNLAFLGWFLVPETSLPKNMSDGASNKAKCDGRGKLYQSTSGDVIVEEPITHDRGILIR